MSNRGAGPSLETRTYCEHGPNQANTPPQHRVPQAELLPKFDYVIFEHDDCRLPHEERNRPVIYGCAENQQWRTRVREGGDAKSNEELQVL